MQDCRARPVEFSFTRLATVKIEQAFLPRFPVSGVSGKRIVKTCFES